MSQTSKNQNKSLVYFINEDSLAESVCRNLAAALSYIPEQVGDSVDIMASGETAALFHRECLDSELYDFLRQVYLTPVPTEIREIDPDFDWDAPFDKKYIVFGEGPEIPDDMKSFFIDVGRLNFNTLLNLLKN